MSGQRDRGQVGQVGPGDAGQVHVGQRHREREPRRQVDTSSSGTTTLATPLAVWIAAYRRGCSRTFCSYAAARDPGSGSRSMPPMPDGGPWPPPPRPASNSVARRGWPSVEKRRASRPRLGVLRLERHLLVGRLGLRDQLVVDVPADLAAQRAVLISTRWVAAGHGEVEALRRAVGHGADATERSASPTSARGPRSTELWSGVLDTHGALARSPRARAGRARRGSSLVLSTTCGSPRVCADAARAAVGPAGEVGRRRHQRRQRAGVRGLGDHLDRRVEDRGAAAGGSAVAPVRGQVGAREAGVRGQRLDRQPRPRGSGGRARR